MVRAHFLALFAAVPWLGLACHSDGTGLEPGARRQRRPHRRAGVRAGRPRLLREAQDLLARGGERLPVSARLGDAAGLHRSAPAHLPRRRRAAAHGPHHHARQTCARAIADQSCEDFLAGVALPTSACPPVVGKLGNGAACVAGNQCQSNYCDRADDQRCGKCADRLGIGRAGAIRSADCAGGLSCQTDATTQARTCRTAAGRAAGEAGRGLWRGGDARL